MLRIGRCPVRDIMLVENRRLTPCPRPVWDGMWVFGGTFRPAGDTSAIRPHGDAGIASLRQTLTKSSAWITQNLTQILFPYHNFSPHTV
jgi:hypothetical protein